MNKTRLVEAVAARTGVTKADTRLMVDAVFTTLKEELTRGKNISYPGFGTLYITKVKAHEAFNPVTGETEMREASRRVSFRAGSELKKAVNQ